MVLLSGCLLLGGVLMLSLNWDMQGWVRHASSSCICYDMLANYYPCIVEIIIQSGSLVRFVSQLLLHLISSLLKFLPAEVAAAHCGKPAAAA